jgi:rhodanese-related sulfurtransferase
MSILDQFKKWAGKSQVEASSGAQQAQRDAMPPPPEPEPIEVPEVNPVQVYGMMQAGEEITLLDVRQRWDHAAQHPAGSISLPLNELPYRLDELEPGKHYVLSCYHGYTSLDGAAFLIEKGFTQVESLRGGFAAWAAAGLPVKRET